MIFEHGWTSFRALCAKPADGVIERRCREQAEFLAVFPECDEECRALLERVTRRPTR